MLQRVRNILRYNQRDKWDRIALSWLEDCVKILDLGCGNGGFASLAPERIIGADLNSKSVAYARRKGCTVVQADIRNLPFQERSLAAIHCSHVIEHFLPQDVHRILSEANRVLQKGGMLVIRSPLLWSNFYSDLTHVRPYNPSAVIHYLVESTQRTLPQISANYRVLRLKWRYAPLWRKIRFLNIPFNFLNRWGFPWLKKNGYMLVMKKC